MIIEPSFLGTWHILCATNSIIWKFRMPIITCCRQRNRNMVRCLNYWFWGGFSDVALMPRPNSPLLLWWLLLCIISSSLSLDRKCFCRFGSKVKLCKRDRICSEYYYRTWFALLNDTTPMCMAKWTHTHTHNITHTEKYYICHNIGSR